MADSERKTKNGDKIKVHYIGRFTDGTIFDSSKDRDPLEFTLGEGQVIPGFEQGLVGLAVGDGAEIHVEPKDGYGESNPDMIAKVEKSQFPAEIKPEVGQTLEMEQPNGQAIPVRITEIEGETVTLDANHPLAGRALEFEVELIEIVE